ncbi:MAG TPA: YncE family protein [Bryobacteraceae bacterium]|nr:YncE family protein [Bryobacteraceae bacterium]
MKLLTLFVVCAAALAQAQPAQIPVDTFPMSAAATPDGRYLLVLSAGLHPPSISVIDLASAKELSRTPVPDAWLGLAISKTGDKVYVGGGARAAVFEFSFANGELKSGRTFPLVADKDRMPQDFAGDVKLAPDGHLLYVANVFRDSVVVMNPQSGVILSRFRTGRRPYRLLFQPSGKTLYVASWADGAIGQYDVNSGERLSNLRLAPHPSDMVWAPGGLPAGATAGSGGAALVARIFVPAANTNNLYVVGATETGDLSKLEAIPLALTPEQPMGTTPSAVALSADKKKIYVACSDANAVAVINISGDRNLVQGYLPAGGYPTAVVGLDGDRVAIVNGHGDSVEVADTKNDFDWGASTGKVLAAFPYRDAGPDAAGRRPGIRHVVYVVRGDEKDAEAVNRAVAGIAPDYTVRLSPATASGRRMVYDFEGQEPANAPPAGYLWNSASQAGLKMRNYGFAVHNLPKANEDGEQVDRVYDPALGESTDLEYRGMDPAYSDIDRAKEFASEMKEYDQVETMPDLLLVRIGKDDAALPILKDAVEKSKFHGEIAMIVVTADSASVGLPAGQAKTGTAVAGLRTVEAILGLRPMTIFDASATPLF